MSVLVDLGHGHALNVVNDYEGVLWGYVIDHPRPDNGQACSGTVPLNGSSKAADHDGWDLVSADPLTLSPSVLCRLCGDHGFVRDGKWVPA